MRRKSKKRVCSKCEHLPDCLMSIEDIAAKEIAKSDNPLGVNWSLQKWTIYTHVKLERHTRVPDKLLFFTRDANGAVKLPIPVAYLSHNEFINAECLGYKKYTRSIKRSPFRTPKKFIRTIGKKIDELIPIRDIEFFSYKGIPNNIWDKVPNTRDGKLLYMICPRYIGLRTYTNGSYWDCL